jgi:Zn-dependent protease
MLDDVNLFDGSAWYLVFLFSTTVHEASHALVALKLGDDTAHRGGQVTLDPIPHIQREPFGMVIVPILSFVTSGWMLGWASAPYDPRWANRYPKRAAWMAAAGPASNFCLMLLSAFAIRLGMLAGWFEPPETLTVTSTVGWLHPGLPHLAAELVGIGFSLNLLLFAFNLLPFPPLDGSSLPLLFLSPSAADQYAEFMRSPATRLIGLVVAWQIFGKVFAPLHAFAIGLLYPSAHYIF